MNKKGKLIPGNHLLYLPNMLLIGALEKNSGKTGLSENIISHFKGNEAAQSDLYAVKITILRECEGKKGFSITEEVNPERKKDTGRLLAAGAKKVLWLKTDEEHTREAVEAVLEKIPTNSMVLCESNSLRLYVKPAVFIMVKRNNSESYKATAAAVKDLVDVWVISYLIKNKIVYSPNVVNQLTIENGEWKIEIPHH